MIDGRLAVAMLGACAATCTAPQPPSKASVVTSTCGVVEQPMANDEIKIGETTVATLSGHRVGISNIWERELPDDKGVVAKRMSATVSLTELPSRKELPELHVFAGSVLSIGADRYCVVRIEEGTDDPGDIYLRKLPP